MSQNMDEKEKTVCVSSIDVEEGYVNIHFITDGRKEIAYFQPTQITDTELKELFRSAAEAGPLDIIKLRKGDKILNISSHLPENKADDPYFLEIVSVQPVLSDTVETDLLHTLEKRVMTLEQELCNQKQTSSVTPCIALRELTRQFESLKKKLETIEHLSWLGFHKQLPEPISSEACRRLQYRRKSDSIKRKVREKFLNICDIVISASVREWLRSPAFDARQWEDEELLLMLQTMFVELEFPLKFNIPLSTLRNFIYEVYNNYNEVPFHNFRHCFCVAQMMYVIVWAVDLITKIGNLEVLILIVSCICHDLDHPGYNNIYQINARTELALRYNDISPLENHHCSVAFRILEAPECNILSYFDSSTYRIVREGIIRCILATDMARHNEILAQFNDIVSNFDFSSKIHINLLSMVLIKVADISNEARPMDIAEPWLDSLLQEFFKQSDAEKLEGLPVTPFMDREKVTKPSSQCSFIGLVLLPLFETLGELFPELQELIVEPVRYALDYYTRLNEAAKDERNQRKSVADLGDHIPHSPHGSHSNNQHQLQQSLQKHQSNSGLTSILSEITSDNCSVNTPISSQSMRLKSSRIKPHSYSQSIENDTKVPTDNETIREIADIESSDPETATEVEISEKTLKFKISTEENCCSSKLDRKSYPNSRKGSRDKPNFDYYYNHEFAKAVREHESKRWHNYGENLNSDMSSPVSTCSNDIESKLLDGLKCDTQCNLQLTFRDGNSKFEENYNHMVDSRETLQNNCISKRTANLDDNECKIRSTSPFKVVKDTVQCCCDDKISLSNHKSFLSRLRSLTDRLSISFDSKEEAVTKSSKCAIIKALNKNITFNSNSGCEKSSTSQPVHSTNIINICKKCNLYKAYKNKEMEGSTNTTLIDNFPNSSGEMRSMTLPKVRRLRDNKNKVWRTVFAKEKRPSKSLETFPAESTIVEIKTSPLPTHPKNLLNPDNESYFSVSKNQISMTNQDQKHKINFKEIDIRSSMPEIFVDPANISSSSAVKNIDKRTIRKNSTSMENMSKIPKQTEAGNLGCSLKKKKSDGPQQHTGSLESILSKDTSCRKNTVALYTVKFSSQTQTQSKKPIPYLFSRFRSGISIDTAGSDNQNSSNSGSIHEQPTNWISSITSSFRSRKHGEQSAQTHIQLK